ncbi:MAG: hypothetical protein U9R11_01225 [Chloroflexota bacterium]|nr:hypothetical protein [Chloroflexota bacterium]
MEHWGERFREIEEAERAKANALPGKWENPCRGARQEGRKGVAMDGSMVHIREEGWKELKVGCVFGVEVLPTLDQETGIRWNWGTRWIIAMWLILEGRRYLGEWPGPRRGGVAGRRPWKPR